tara:strand:+ start:3165 stop:3797 length:633 start_codon:yes stop_codon:yes gene_type:complete
MEQLLNVILPPVAVALFSGLLIKISLSVARQTWSNNYQYTLICLILPIITFVITKVISNNIALSLGMVGALSIVRFRNPVKNSLELVIYFALIAVGISAGVNIKYSILLGILVSLIILFLNYVSLFFKKINLNFSSLSHNDRIQTNILEIESNKELKKDQYSKYLQSFYCDQEQKKYYYRFECEHKEEADKIYENFKSLEHILSIDIKYG